MFSDINVIMLRYELLEIYFTENLPQSFLKIITLVLDREDFLNKASVLDFPKKGPTTDVFLQFFSDFLATILQCTS